MTKLRKTVDTYWTSAENRDWTTFAVTLADDVRYDLPQTRERIHGKENFVRFNRDYPGDWHLRTRRTVADPDTGEVVTWARVTVGAAKDLHAVSFFTADTEGRIATITDFWPEPYEPPTGRAHLVERY
ncbi:nuclear transport factor 2 family protein [Streptomyces hypolithicus]